MEFPPQYRQKLVKVYLLPLNGDIIRQLVALEKSLVVLQDIGDSCFHHGADNAAYLACIALLYACIKDVWRQEGLPSSCPSASGHLLTPDCYSLAA